MPTTSKKTTLTGGRRVKKYAKERAVKRIPFVAAVEVVEVRTGTKLVARTSELGAGGCYVDALTPYGIGTAVAIKLIRGGGESFYTRAKVVYSDASFGMGLRFEGLDPEQRSVLEDWVADIVLAERGK
jgi:hypothetical protein